MPAALIKPKRVLFLVPDLTIGGVERVSLNLLRHLPTDRFTCDLFTCGDSTVMASEVPAHVRHFPGVSSDLRMRQGFPRLVRLLRSRITGYDIVVATSPHTTALMHLACLGRRIRKISWVHFSTDGFMPRTTSLIRGESRLFYPLTEERVFVSEGVRSSFSEYFGRKAADQVIHNIFDPAAYRLPCRLSATVGRLKSSGKPVLGVVSRLVEQKGLPELLQIHQELLARGFDHHLVVIGDGPLEAALSEEVSSKRLAPSFHLLGADPSPLAAMRLCDLMLLTSEHEAWPTVILEAFHAHTPIISFACPSGPPELLTGSLQGCLVHQRTAHAFADTVQYAYAHRAELVRAGARRLADFTPEMIIPYWMALLR